MVVREFRVGFSGFLRVLTYFSLSLTLFSLLSWFIDLPFSLGDLLTPHNSFSHSQTPKHPKNSTPKQHNEKFPFFGLEFIASISEGECQNLAPLFFGPKRCLKALRWFIAINLWKNLDDSLEAEGRGGQIAFVCD